MGPVATRGSENRLTLPPVPAVEQVGIASVNMVIIDGSADTRTVSSLKTITSDGSIHPLRNLVGSVALTAAMHTFVMNGTSLTVTLPDPSTVPRDRERMVKNIHSTALSVVSAGTSKTIDGAASDSLAQWETGRYVSNGTQWIVV